MEVIRTAKLLKWGNSYGLRISKRDVERAGLRPGAEIRVRLEQEDVPAPAPHFTFNSGHTDTSARHDELLYGWPSDA